MTKKKKICLLVGVLMVIIGLGLFGFTAAQGATGFRSKHVTIGLDDDGELGLVIHEAEDYASSRQQEVSSSTEQPGGSPEVSANGGGDTKVILDNSEICELHLAVEYAKVKVQPGNSFSVTTRGIRPDQITVTNDGGVVSVSGGQEDWLKYDDNEVLITVPSGVRLDVIAGKISVGEVEIDRLDVADIELGVETGSVSIEETTADYLSVSCTVGEVDLFGSFGSVEAEVVTGQIDFEGIASSLKLTGITGEIDAELRSADYWGEVRCENGVIEINDREYFDGYASWGSQPSANTADISLTTGDVSVEFLR